MSVNIISQIPDLTEIISQNEDVLYTGNLLVFQIYLLFFIASLPDLFTLLYRFSAGKGPENLDNLT